MKKLYLGLLCIVQAIALFAQNEANHWIDYSQKYYRIPITQSGVYRITYNDLVSNGISVGDFDSRNLQIYYNGKQIPLFINSASPIVFDTQDYIEFYAPSGNTGWLDSAMYINAKSLNPAYSLYNDTASYFLTFANTLQSPRYDTARTTNYDDYTALQYCFKTIRQNFTSTFNSSAHTPYITPNEGWCDNFFDYGVSTTKFFSTPNFAQVGLPYTLDFGFCGFSDTRHDILVETSQSSHIFDTVYHGYQAVHKSISIPNSPLGNNLSVTFRSLYAANKIADKNSVAYIELTYPHTYNFEASNNFTFQIPKVTTGEYILLTITNFDGGNNPLFFSPDIQKRIRAEKTGNTTYKLLIPNPKRQITGVLTHTNAIRNTPIIQSVRTKNSQNSSSVFFNLRDAQNQAEYIIIAHQSLWAQAVEYKNYRELSGFKTTLIDVQELYNQFAFGVHKHPMAIYNFIDYASSVWGIKAEYILLIGKGLQVDNFRNNKDLYAQTLIPGMGYPSSDLLFTVNLQSKNVLPKLAIGRLATTTNTDVESYRKKVQEHENQPPAAWMKTVMQFGGGRTEGEKKIMSSYLKVYEKIMKQDYFGANVYTFLKETSDVFEKTEPEAVRENMNNGCSMLNFFGHASGTGFDQSIDHPALFDNKGKYPFILANSCYTGDVFTTSTGVNELWTFIPERGSIGFLANIDYGSPAFLHTFSLPLINNITYNNFNQPIGKSIQLTLQEISNKYNFSQEIKDAAINFLYHGDPAVRMQNLPLPDLELRSSSIFTTPAVVTDSYEDFMLHAVVYNNGKTTQDTCQLRIVFSSDEGVNDTIVYDIRGLYAQDTFSFVLPTRRFESGAYTIHAYIDAYDTITEYDETNNSASTYFFISSRDVVPAYPRNYAIIPHSKQVLSVSAVDPLHPPHSIIIEIDTSATYTSPVKKSATLETNGHSLIQWDSEITFIENKVYFWRVTNADSIKWNESSFVYEKDKHGWAQIHPHQFIQNQRNFLEFDAQENRYSYATIQHRVLAKNLGVSNVNPHEIFYFVDSYRYGTSGNIDALHVAVLDSVSLQPWYANRAYYGQYNANPSSVNARYFIFDMRNVAGRNNFKNFIKNHVPDENYVLIYSYRNAYYSAWDEEMKELFDSLGAKQHREAIDGYPYIFFGKKADTLYAKELLGISTTDEITLQTTVVTHHTEGTQYSPKIGPSTNFHEVLWQSDAETYQRSYLQLKTITTDNEIHTLAHNATQNLHGLDTLIQTQFYPYISLENYTKDDILRTPPHLDFWKVYFDPVGELIVTPEYVFSINKPTIEQGDELQIIVSAKNVSIADMDSVLVSYEIIDENNALIARIYKKTPPALSNTYILDTLTLPTNQLSGNYTIRIEFNAIDTATHYYNQLEAYRLNNLLTAQVRVTTDATQPNLLVTIDNRTLEQGDYVPNNPKILVKLIDNNKYLRLTDTSAITIRLLHHESNTQYSYFYADSVVQFTPATAEANICHALLQLHNLIPGTYTLYVQAKDASGNYAGAEPYEIDFKVADDSQISVLYNYPNPSRDYTIFSYTIAGSQKPENMHIAIYSSSGALIHRIPVHTPHIGKNKISVQWNLTDAAGKKLSPGTYFYTLEFNNSSEFTHLPTKNDAFMYRKYGKLLIE